MSNQNRYIYENLHIILEYVNRNPRCPSNKILAHLWQKIKERKVSPRESNFSSEINATEDVSKCSDFLLKKGYVTRDLIQYNKSEAKGASVSTKPVKEYLHLITVEGVILLNKGGFKELYELEEGVFSKTINDRKKDDQIRNLTKLSMIFSILISLAALAVSSCALLSKQS